MADRLTMNTPPYVDAYHWSQSYHGGKLQPKINRMQNLTLLSYQHF